LDLGPAVLTWGLGLRGGVVMQDTLAPRLGLDKSKCQSGSSNCDSTEPSRRDTSKSFEYSYEDVAVVHFMVAIAGKARKRFPRREEVNFENGKCEKGFFFPL
jgi:hypothetical protein